MSSLRPQTIFVDVDDTLVRSVGQTRIPMSAVVADIRRLRAAGHRLFLWSSGGVEYARTSAEELGIAGWRFCRHILPGNSGEIE